MSEPKWLAEARKDIGIKEGPGMSNNPRVIRMYAECGSKVTDDRVAWCAAAVGAWLHRAGLPNTKSLLAISYAKYGQPLAGPVVGCIGVRTREGGSGHVGIVTSTGPGVVNLLAGNQSDAVNIAAHPRSKFVAFRWPPGVPLPSAARAPLETHHPKPKMSRSRRHG